MTRATGAGDHWDLEHDHVTAATRAPWAFALNTALSPSGTLHKEAARRGVSTTNEALQRLWQLGWIAPMVEIRRTAVAPSSVSTIPEPAFASAATLAIQIARDEGRLVDPNERGFRSGIRMESAMGQPGSRRIGIAYSEWQLLDLHWLRHLIKWSHRNPGESIRGPNRWDLIACRRHRCLTTLLVALESRYLPEISRPTVHLTNADYSEWATFRSSFDPVQTLANIGCPRDRLPFLADHLLSTANRVDPLKGRLSSLIRRTSQNAWDDLEGDARAAHDHRRAAEVILLCHEDIGPSVKARFPTPRLSGRLNNRAEPLDRVLSRVGLSPHPRAVLIVEGQTEELLVPRVRDRIRVPTDSQALRVVNSHGSSADLTRLVSAIVSPIISPENSDDGSLGLERPPTFVMIAMDPENAFSPSKIKDTVDRIVDEIARVIEVQGYSAKRSDLEQLVTARTWSAGCFEFTHFTDAELARAIVSTCTDRHEADVVSALAETRLAGSDIEWVWKRKGWKRQPRKQDLAERLWPAIEERLERLDQDASAPVPEIAQRIHEAYQLGAQVRPGTWRVQREDHR